MCEKWFKSVATDACRAWLAPTMPADCRNWVQNEQANVLDRPSPHLQPTRTGGGGGGGGGGGVVENGSECPETATTIPSRSSNGNPTQCRRTPISI